MPEGSLVFPGEPMLRIVAPIIEGQIMETYLLSTLSYQTMIASKAARVVTAAQGRQIVDFCWLRAPLRSADAKELRMFSPDSNLA